MLAAGDFGALPTPPHGGKRQGDCSASAVGVGMNGVGRTPPIDLSAWLATLAVDNDGHHSDLLPQRLDMDSSNVEPSMNRAPATWFAADSLDGSQSSDAASVEEFEVRRP